MTDREVLNTVTLKKPGIKHGDWAPGHVNCGTTCSLSGGVHWGLIGGWEENANHQLIKQCIIQLIMQFVNQSINQSIDRSINQSINPLISQSVNQSE